jgi:poly(hydroxyalkanoate) depolymerase family esterase
LHHFAGTRVKLHDISNLIDRALASAGLDTKTPLLANVSDAVRASLDAAGLTQHRREATADAGTRPIVRPVVRPLRRLDETSEGGASIHAFVDEPGQFTTHTFSNGQAQRDYKLFVPSGHADKALPLVVMLHGCKQNPDDFARGTQMNALAQAEGFVVAYPAQTARANGSNCWNWFDRSQQGRGGEEPALIAGIARDAATHCRVEEARVFVAGLSAGAAMAVIAAATYPDVFKAVAAHSGLPLGAAHDVPSAFAAMQGSPARSDFTGRPSRGSERFSEARLQGVPTIVFHGDADTTVRASNGRLLAEQAVHSFDIADVEALTARTESVSAGGRECEVTRHIDDTGHCRVEEWVVHGAGHAWFGGDAKGSYADAAGPDASAEMMRFFLAQ